MTPISPWIVRLGMEACCEVPVYFVQIESVLEAVDQLSPHGYRPGLPMLSRRFKAYENDVCVFGEMDPLCTPRLVTKRSAIGTVLGLRTCILTSKMGPYLPYAQVLLHSPNEMK